MDEAEIRRLRRGDRVWCERHGGATVDEVWALSLSVFVVFDDGRCYYPRDQHHLIERESVVLARRRRPGPRARLSPLATRAA